jgi:hypothetical protein
MSHSLASTQPPSNFLWRIYVPPFNGGGDELVVPFHYVARGVQTSRALMSLRSQWKLKRVGTRLAIFQ